MFKVTLTISKALHNVAPITLKNMFVEYGFLQNDDDSGIINYPDLLTLDIVTTLIPDKSYYENGVFNLDKLSLSDKINYISQLKSLINDKVVYLTKANKTFTTYYTVNATKNAWLSVLLTYIARLIAYESAKKLFKYDDKCADDYINSLENPLIYRFYRTAVQIVHRNSKDVFTTLGAIYNDEAVKYANTKPILDFVGKLNRSQLPHITIEITKLWND